jgi:hypothetical protein
MLTVLFTISSSVQKDSSLGSSLEAAIVDTSFSKAINRVCRYIAGKKL